MRSLSLSFVSLLVIFTTCIFGVWFHGLPVAGVFVLPRVHIDLDASAPTRWKSALDVVLSSHSWEDSFGPVFQAHQNVFDKLPEGTLERIQRALRLHFPIQFSELVGLSQSFSAWGHPEVTVEYLSAWSYYHELAHARFQSKLTSDDVESRSIQHKDCTGVLVVRKDGIVIHGRNMDNEPSAARNLTLHMILTRDNGSTIVGEAVDWYWFNGGFMTAFRPGVASVQENWRLGSDDVDGEFILRAIDAGVMPQVFFFRAILFGGVQSNSYAKSFSEVLTFLSEQPTAAPMYNILAGPDPWQGAVISRDPFRQLPRLDLKTNATDGWFLVQTNYDHWLPDPTEDNRRTHATTLLRTMGQFDASSTFGMMALLSTYPVHNQDTVLTGVMCPKTGFVQMFGQEGISLAK